MLAVSAEVPAVFARLNRSPISLISAKAPVGVPDTEFQFTYKSLMDSERLG